MPDTTGAKSDYIEDESAPKPTFSEKRPEYIYRKAVTHPSVRFGRPREYVKEVKDGMTIERDVKVPVRGGVHIWCDIFKPEQDSGKLAPLIAWTPYGKHTPGKMAFVGRLTVAPIGKLFPKSGVLPEHTSDYTAFEAPDPMYWTRHGYAIIVADCPGTWYGDGKVTYTSPEEAELFYDLIEWAGVQEWSSGLVGLSGVSYLAVMQWRVAELSPPHLGAINPDEGWTDFYREVVYHGGIPDSSFFPRLIGRWGSSTQEIEDLETEAKVHPFFDAFWESKRAQLDKITCPAYVVASWQDQGLHTRGTLEGWKKINSKEKWLECHGRKKWAFYYLPEQVEKQRAFFDKYLKGKKDTGVEKWPPVILEIRDGFYKGKFREEKEFPIARTEYKKFFLDASQGALTTDKPEKEAIAKYDALASGPGNHRVEFDIEFTEETEITGCMSAKLFMETSASDDMHVFLTLWKLDKDHQPVGMTYYAQYENGPAACGWIKASHRELDEKSSTPQQPVLLHRMEQKVKPGEIVELNIEIWPGSTHFAPGEGLRLLVQGTDVMKYREPEVYARHEWSVNSGDHIIHTGGKHPSSLLLPIIPT